MTRGDMRLGFGALAVAVIVITGIGIAKNWKPAQPVEPERPYHFSLIDSTSKPVTDENFRGDWLVVFFGFTNCPQACPTALFKLAHARKSLGADADHMRVVMITVDPERDSPEALGAYLRSYGPAFSGLTGSHEQVEGAKNVFRAYAQKQLSSDARQYMIEHSTSFFVLNPRGEFRRQISSDVAPEDLAKTLRNVMQADGA